MTPITPVKDLHAMADAEFGRLIAHMIKLPAARLGVVAARLMRVGAYIPRAAMLATAALEELELRAREETGNQVDLTLTFPDGNTTEERI